MKFFLKGMGHFILLLCLMWQLPSEAMPPQISPEVFVDNGSLQLVSSRRVSRRVTEYTLNVLAANEGSRQFENVTAKLTSVPSGITVVGSDTVSLGFIDSTGTALSSNSIVIQLNIRMRPDINQMQWTVFGDVYTPPPPPSTAPSELGTFIYWGDEYKGEVENKSHDGWTRVLSWQEGISTSVDQFGSIGKVNQDDISIVKYVDSLSPILRELIASGEFLDEIKIDVIGRCRDNLYTQYAITLVDNALSSVSASGSGGEDKLIESVTINTRLMETVYIPVDQECRVQRPVFSYREMTF